MNNESEINREKWQWLLSRHFADNIEEMHEEIVRVGCIRTEIWTQDSPVFEMYANQLATKLDYVGVNQGCVKYLHVFLCLGANSRMPMK